MNQALTAHPDGLVAAVIYHDGRRVECLPTVAETNRRLHQRPGTMAWIGLSHPAETQLLAAAAEFGLRHLAVEDAIKAHQRPKLDRYRNTLFVVLRTARYVTDHATTVAERVDSFRQMLDHILTVNATLVSPRERR